MKVTTKLPAIAPADVTSIIGGESVSGGSLAQLEAILASINDGVIVADLRGHLLWMNPAALAMHGYESIEEARSQMVENADTFELHESESHSIDRSLLVRVLAGEKFSAMEMRRRRKDTGTVWYGSYSGTAVRDKAGNAVLAVLTLRDITERRVQEKALVDSKIFLQSTLDALSAHIAILDEKGVIITVNAMWRQFAQANGFNGGALGLGANYLEICESATGECSSEAAVVAAGIRSVMEKRRDEFHTEYPCHSPAAQRWFIVRVTRFGGEGPMRIVVAHENITKRKLAEEALRKAHDDLERRVLERTRELSESHARLATLLESIADGFLTLDFNWRYTRVNAAAMKFLRLGPEDLLGKTIWEVFPAMDQTRFGAKLRQAVAENRPTRIEEFYPEPLNRWYEARFYPSHEGLSIFFTDVTERKMAEEANARLAEIVESSNDAIIGKQLDGVITSWNRGAELMFGYTSEEAVGQNIGLIIPSDRKGEESSLIERLGRGETVSHFETKRLTKDGRQIDVSITASPLRDSDGKIVGASKIARDISLRKRAEEISREAYAEMERRVRDRTAELTKANTRLKAEIAGRRRLEEEILQIAEREQRRLGQDLHDDLGQQLTGIGLLAKILAADLSMEAHGKSTDANELLAMLKEAIHGARSLAKGFYPIELERGGLILALSDLAQRVQTVSQVHCEVRHDEGFRFDEAHSIHLYRIVQESLNNAIKHAKPQNIVIECTSKKGVPVLTITDDGVGFHKPKKEITGMGLHLFQYRARLIGAKLTVGRGKKGGCVVACHLKG